MALFSEESFDVIELVEYMFDNTTRKRTFVYVPILSVLTELPNTEESLALQFGHYKTFHDGLFYKENPIFSKQQFTIAIGLCLDNFKICNPLGTARKKNKVCGVYYLCILYTLQWCVTVMISKHFG